MFTQKPHMISFWKEPANKTWLILPLIYSKELRWISFDINRFAFIRGWTHQFWVFQGSRRAGGIQDTDSVLVVFTLIVEYFYTCTPLGSFIWAANPRQSSNENGMERTFQQVFTRQWKHALIVLTVPQRCVKSIKITA